MAQRRMFSQQIVDSDAFLEMPATSQLLYFHLAVRGDDDGFVGNPKKIQRMIGVNDDDLKILIAKRFLIIFESGVVVIKHWRIHNLIRADRYNETSYIEEKAQLRLKENNSYTLATTRQPNDNQMAPQVSIGEVSIGKEDCENSENSESSHPVKKEPSTHKKFIDFFYETARQARGVKPIITAADGKNLKRVLGMKILTPLELQQAATFFLVDSQYRKFSPTVSTFLSAGILTGIANTMNNRGSDFWKLISDWQTSIKPIGVEDGVKNTESMPDRILQMKEELAKKMSLPKRV